MPGQDEYFMSQALAEARFAVEEGEVPVGAVIVREGRIIGRGRNQRELSGDPTAHAEMEAIRAASRETGGWRLEDTALYVTLEPCPMCAGAIVLSRIGRLIFGVRDPKAGAVVSLMNILGDDRLNHQVEVVEGVLADECGAILREFFQDLRRAAKQKNH